MNKPKVVAVVGTNASGKSALGVRLAGTFDGEIISADSRQVFRGLDLGSGKITPEEMQGVPHYMIDVREPGEFFSMADFQRMSYEKIDEIRARGHLPMIVGGTGLYVDSVLDGYLLSDKEPDLAYRAELEKLTTPALYAQLVALMPDVQVERNNRNRVMRMLERIHDGDDAVPAKQARFDSLRFKEQENGMFGRAANWMEGILTMMDNLGDAAEDEGDFVYPERDENDRCLDNRFNDVLDRSPDAAM